VGYSHPPHCARLIGELLFQNSPKRSIKSAYDEMMGFKNAMELHRANDALVIDASQIEEKKKLMGTLMEKGFKAFLELRDGPFRNNP